MESPVKYTSMRPFFAFSRSCSCAALELASVRATGVTPAAGLVAGSFACGCLAGSFAAGALRYRDAQVT